MSLNPPPLLRPPPSEAPTSASAATARDDEGDPAFRRGFDRIHQIVGSLGDGVVSNDVFYSFTYVYEATGVFKELGVTVIPGDELEVAVNNADTLSNIFQRCLELFPAHGKGVRCFAGEKSKILELDLLAAAPDRPLTCRRDVEDAAPTGVAGALAAAAAARTEARGCHHRADYPDTDPAQARSRRLEPEVARA